MTANLDFLYPVRLLHFLIVWNLLQLISSRCCDPLQEDDEANSHDTKDSRREAGEEGCKVRIGFVGASLEQAASGNNGRS